MLLCIHALARDLRRFLSIATRYIYEEVRDLCWKLQCCNVGSGFAGTLFSAAKASIIRTDDARLVGNAPGFPFVLWGQERSCVLYASSEQERNLWLTTIDAVMTAMRKSVAIRNQVASIGSIDDGIRLRHSISSVDGTYCIMTVVPVLFDFFLFSLLLL